MHIVVNVLWAIFCVILCLVCSTIISDELILLCLYAKTIGARCFRLISSAFTLNKFTFLPFYCALLCVFEISVGFVCIRNLVYAISISCAVYMGQASLCEFTLSCVKSICILLLTKFASKRGSPNWVSLLQMVLDYKILKQKLPHNIKLVGHW